MSYSLINMKITMLAVGKLKEKYLADAVKEYLKRIKPYATVEIIELLECRTVEEEGVKLLARIPAESWVCVLDVHGELVSSENLAKVIADLTLSGQSKLTFVIGGAFGISQNLRETAAMRLSLSKMTFTHQMTRLILLEQIYRTFKINRGEPYHW